MTSLSLMQSHLSSLEAFLSDENYERAYDVFIDLETGISTDPSKRQEDIVLKMSVLFLGQFLPSSSPPERKIDLCNRIALHLSCIETQAATIALIKHLFERACLDFSHHAQINYLTLALRIAQLSPDLLLNTECVSQIRNRVAEITHTNYLHDIFEVAIGKNIEKKLRSGDLKKSLDQIQALTPLLGSVRIGQMMGIANKKIVTLSNSGYDASQGMHISELILFTGFERDRLAREAICPSTSLAEQLQNRHTHFLTKFKDLFHELGEKRFNPNHVRDFQQKIFQAFCLFLNQELLTEPPFFLFKILPPSDKYLLSGFGSLGRQELCPFSDLEYGVLHSTDQDPVPLQQLVDILHFEIGLLGNHSLQPKEEGLLTPQVSRERFHIDSLANPVDNSDLMATPENLAALQTAEPYQLSKIPPEYSLHRMSALNLNGPEPEELPPEHPLLNEYRQKIDACLCQTLEEGVVTKEASTVGQQRMLHIIKQLVDLFEKQHRENQNNFPTTCDEPTIIDLKKQLIHPLFILLESLALYHTSIPDRTPEQQELATKTNTIDIIEGLVKVGVCAPTSGQLLQETVAALYTTRVRLHLEYDHCCDKAAFTKTESNAWIILDAAEKSALIRAYWLVIEPLYKNLRRSINVQGPPLPIDLLAPETLLTWNEQRMQLFGEYTARKYPPEIWLYQELLVGKDTENLRYAYLTGLQRGGAPESLITELSQNPNLDGYRQSYRIAYDALYTDIDAMSTLEPTDPTDCTAISSPALGTRYLKKEVLDQIINPNTTEGLIRKQYDALHNVAKAELGPHSLHFKEHPTQPWMDYAICNLLYRLFGHGAIPTELVKVIVHKNGTEQTHYLQLSKTVEGKVLSEVDWSNTPLNHRKIIEMMIGTIIVKPADGRRSNYLMFEDTQGQSSLLSIDNDASLVDPVIYENDRLLVLFKSALFCYDELLRLPVDTESMQAFFALNPIPLLLGWASDVINTQERWVAHAFENPELAETVMDILLNSIGQECNLRFLMREGGLFNLFSQIFKLQDYFGRCLQAKKQPMSIELLDQIVGIGVGNLPTTHIGKYVYNQYLKGIKAEELAHRRLAYNTGDLVILRRANIEQSKSRSETLAMTLGNLPNGETIQYTRFSIEQSLKEIAGLAGFGGAVISEGECRTVQANFQEMSIEDKADECRQEIFLALLTQIKDIEHLDLSHSAVLDEQKLKNILSGSPGLRILNVSHCPKLILNNLSPVLNLTGLEALNMSHCPGLTEIRRAGLTGLFRRVLTWPGLKKLRIDHCPNLRDLSLNAPDLLHLNIKETPRLAIENLEAPRLIELLRTSGEDHSLQNRDVLVKVPLPLLLSPQLSSFPFGKAKWEKYFGEVGEEPPIPLNIEKILLAPCPFWSNQKVFETHLLVLIPQMINGEPLTFNRLRELNRNRLGGYPTKFDVLNQVIEDHGDTKNRTSHWILMTKNIVSPTRYTNYAQQQDIVTRLGPQYQAPTLLDATVSVMAEHVESGRRLFSNIPITYTRCQEKTEDCQVIVGSFFTAGLSVYSFNDNTSVGLAAARKF